MDIVRKRLSELRQYKLPAVLAPVFTLAAVGLEVLIPFVMALLIDEGIAVGDMGQVMKWGLIMLLCAALALLVGSCSGIFGSEAATGLASNLRDALFEKVQTYSFSNIDKFSTAGLVTRMTTDVTNVQNAFQMTLIIATRAPITLIASLAMCIIISPSLSSVFFVAMVVLGVALFSIMFKTMPLFGHVFERYDDLNSSVQENVTAIRVVKAFVREDHEDKKFSKAAGELYDLFVKAESLLAWNNPIMMCATYGCIIALSWFGTHSILAGQITTGELTSLLGYVMNILVSLMMLTMIFVMVTMSAASGQRIVEVLDEQPDIVSPAHPLTKVTDGQVIEAGAEITEGSVNPHDIMKIRGIRAVQDYLLREVQRVYRLQGVEINDKHIEVIVRQMLKKVRIEKQGDTDFLPGSYADFLEFEDMNEKLVAEGKEPAEGVRIVLGITKAALATDSFLSAASFQETTKVLTDAAIKGRIDPLIGLKENVIIGQLIPAGTGLRRYRDVKLDTDARIEEKAALEKEKAEEEARKKAEAAKDEAEEDAEDTAEGAEDIADEDLVEDTDSAEDVFDEEETSGEE